MMDFIKGKADAYDPNVNMQLLISTLLITSCISTEIPKKFKRCNRRESNFQKCLIEASQDFLRKSTLPANKIGLPVLDPLDIPFMVIGAGTRTVGVQQNYKNVRLSGISNATCYNAGMDFTKKLFSLECTSLLIRIAFNYDINGRILLLPIYGKGPGVVDLENIDVKLKFKFEEYMKKEVKHYKVVESQVTLAPQLMITGLQNLFDGDKALGDNINKVFNDNWKEIFEDVKSSYEDAFAQIFSSVFNNVLKKVSVVELFGEE